MSVQNEVVKFIAEIDLDAQDKENFLQGLKECDKECSDLRDGILHLQNSMAKLRAEGKENTKEFKDLQDALASKTKTLKETTKQADKYSSALGASRMSMNQLKKHAKELQTAMNNMHKESNPAQWAKYEKELKLVNARIKELKTGTDGAKKGIASMAADIANGFTISNGVTTLFNGAIKLAKAGFQKFTQETQVWGDKWQMTVTKVNAGWSQFIANIGQGKDVIKASASDAIKAAADAQLLLDELFERENSLKIQSVKTQTEINTLMATVKDASKSDAERMAAIEEILKLENALADLKRQIAQQELDAYQGPLSARTGLEKEELKVVIDNYNANRDKFKLAEEYIALLEKEKSIESRISGWSTSYGPDSKMNEYIDEQIASLRSELAQVQELKETMGTEEVLEYKRLLEQYNLGNDGLVENYVNATIKLEEANANLANQTAQLAARRGRLMNEMSAADKDAADKAYSDAVENAEKTARVELNTLKEQLLKKEITQEEFNKKSEEIELRRLENLKEINKKYGKDITVIEGQILDKRLQAQASPQNTPSTTAAENNLSSKPLMPLPSIKLDSAESGGLAISLPGKSFEEDLAALEILYRQGIASEKSYLLEKSKLRAKYGKSNLETEKALMEMSLAALEKQHEAGKIKEEDYQREKQAIVLRYLESTGDPATESFKSEFAALDAAYGNGLISWEEYLIKRNELFDKYNGQASESSKTLWEKGAEGALQGTLTMLNAASEMVSSIKEAELAQLDAQKEKELAAAGDNAEKRAAIEEKYEAQKLETQKKYADVEMGINIATALAQGALAVIQAWAQLGPIAGGIFAAIVAATTAAQIAVMVQQRNAIKNSSASGGSGSTTTRVVNGYSEGGYTGDGGRLEVAGVVHRGEYVVPQPELRDPAVAAMVASIESRRRRRTSANALPGFAEGGYTGATSGGRHTDELLDKILVAIERGNSTPAKAYVVLSDLNEKQKQQSRMNKKSSLRPRP